jgi:hypothetical protein
MKGPSARSKAAQVEFMTTLKKANAEGTWTYISVPARAMKAFAPRQRVPVSVTVGGQTYRSTIAPMGGEFCIPVRAEVRDAAGVAAGMRVLVRLELDQRPRTVAVPKDLASALRRSGMRKTFDALSYSHRKEYVEWVAQAKRPQTRATRMAKVIEAVKLRTSKPE